jgi:hypothetical protein
MPVPEDLATRVPGAGLMPVLEVLPTLARVVVPMPVREVAPFHASLPRAHRIARLLEAIRVGRWTIKRAGDFASRSRTVANPERIVAPGSQSPTLLALSCASKARPRRRA